MLWVYQKKAKKIPVRSLTKAGNKLKLNDDGDEAYFPPAEQKQADAQKAKKTGRGNRRKVNRAKEKREKEKVCIRSYVYVTFIILY
jgi:hypothetical protein